MRTAGIAATGIATGVIAIEEIEEIVATAEEAGAAAAAGEEDETAAIATDKP